MGNICGLKVKKSNVEEEEEEEEEEEDRLSALPDALIHQVFSLMDMGDVVRTSILAKRWKNLWLDVPTLNFSLLAWNKEYFSSKVIYTFYLKNDKVRIKKKQSFIEFVDKVLLIRGNHPIEKISLSEYNCFIGETHVSSWIMKVLSTNFQLQHLSIDLPVIEKVELPPHMFTSNLKTLKLKIDQKFSHVRLPSSFCTAPRIESMELHYAVIPDGDDNGKLVLSCPMLKTLKMSYCYSKNLNQFDISTPLLEALKLHQVSFNKETPWNEVSCAYPCCMVTINTPNVKSFEVFSSRCCGRYYVKDLSSLDYAFINIWPEKSPHFFGVDDYNKRCRECLIEILSKIYNAEHLRLSFQSTQILADFPDSVQRLPELFHNLKYLLLEAPFEAPLHGLLKLLKRFPCLETLMWKDSEREVQQNLEEELLFDCKFYQLKSIRIKNFGNWKNEYKFLEFLLKSALMFEKLSVVARKKPSSDKHLAEVCKKLQDLPRASSSVTIQVMRAKK